MKTFKISVLSKASALALGLSISASFGVFPQQAKAQQSPPQVPETVESRIPVAEFVKQPNMGRVKISPDATKLAYVAGRDGREMLVVLDLETMQELPILAANEARESGDRTMSEYRWIGNDHVVATVISRENLYGQLADFRRLVAFDVKTRQSIPQAWRDAGGDAGAILHIDHDKGKYLLQRDSVANSTERWGFPEVVEVDVSTGKFEMVQRTNPVVRAWAADSDGEIRAGFNSNPDDGKFRMLYKADGERNFKTVYNEADETRVGSIPTPELFIPGTDMAYTISNHDGVDKVYKMNMKTMEIVETAFETEGFDVQGIIPSKDDSKLVGVRTFDGTMRLVWTNENLKTVQTILDETFGQDKATIVDWSNDFMTQVIYVGGLERNGGYYLYDLKSGKFRLLNWDRTALKDAPLNPVKAEWYTASDGTKIQAVVTYPRHRVGEKNLPVIVMPHGGPFGALSATNSTEPWNQPLAEQGYVVIQPNYRGSGGYGKEFVKIGRQPGGYGKRMQDDLNDILTEYGKKGIIDPTRACIMGWSYGGYAAARGAQRDPELWKCAIAGAGVYDMPMMNKWDSKNLGRFSSGFQATSEDPEGISSARNTNGPWAPILIVTAKRDARIPMEQAETLVANLRKSGKVEGKDYRYIVQEQGTHNLPYDDVHIQWIEEAYAWLERFNPAYIQTDKTPEPSLMDFN